MVKGFNVSLSGKKSDNVDKCGCADGTCENISSSCPQHTCGPTWTEALECIEFEGMEILLPRGWQSPHRNLTLEKLFLNWNDVDDPIDLVVNTEYINKLNKIYSGKGLLLGDPNSNENLTLEEWDAKFPYTDKYNGVLLLGIKMHDNRKGVYIRP